MRSYRPISLKLAILLALLFLVACQRQTFNLGMTKEKNDDPHYTVKPSINGSVEKIGGDKQ